MSKIMNDEANKHKIYLNYTEDHICTREPYEDDDWDRGEFDISFYIRGISCKPCRKNYNDEIEVSFDPKDQIDNKIHLVVVRYSDGDTFGCTTGYWKIVKAFIHEDKQDAVDLSDSINNGKYKGYKEWDGYFASLQCADVETFELEG
jgi:hypothetical protein